MRLCNSDYEIIMREYDGIRYRNHRLHLRRKEEIYGKFPEIGAIDDELSSSAAALAKKGIFLSDVEYEALLREFAEKKKALLQKKEDLLLSHGYDRAYLSEIYSCPDCKDTGFLGKEKCHCFKEAARTLLKNREELVRLPENATFDAFHSGWYDDSDKDPDTGKSSRDTALAAVSYCKDFVSSFSETSGNLLIYGNTGVGKTFLAGCIANALSGNSYSVGFVTAYKFFNLTEQSAFGKNSGDEKNVHDSLSFLMDTDLLVLDDIGTEVINTFTATRLYEWINERILKKKSTVITTNLSPYYIKTAYSERIFSRLAGNYRFIKLTGSDIRPRRKLPDLTKD